MKIVIHGLINLKEDEKEKIRTALKMGEEVLDSDIWLLKISSLKFKGTKKTGADVAHLILSGADAGGVDRDIDIEIEGFFSWKGTVGYTYLKALKTYINRRFLRKFDYSEVFGHIMHELMHRLGFAHQDNVSKKDDVAYQVGYASRAAFKEYFVSGKPPRHSLAELAKPVSIIVASLLICWNVWGKQVCFVGDTGTGEADQYRVAAAMAKSCEMVMHVGDIIYEKGLSGADDPQLASKFLLPYAQILLKNTPIYITLGNHDYYGNEKAWFDIAKQYPLIHFPNYFYEVRVDDYCFLAIDAHRGGTDQWKFVRQKRDCIATAFGHWPYKSSGAHGDAKLEWPFLYSVVSHLDFYIAGHDHQLSDEGTHSGMRQLISGAGASTRKIKGKPKWGASVLGFLILDTKKKEFRFVDVSGRVLHTLSGSSSSIGTK